jgi:peptidoglycan/LPS O-acetylase OafA/YrhL
MIVAKNQGYRADIDGLRAVAVGAVVLFHAFPEYVPGGFAGVDVFFVISGFLISRLIFDQAESGSFSLPRFYARRVRRLFPALAVVLFTATAVGWLILLPEAYARLGTQVAASSVFAANIYFWLQSSYFSPDAHTFPLLHLWSLGVEEQFYIAWPLLVMALGGRRRWLWAAMLVGAVSLMLSCFFADRPALDFYSPFTRAWELMAGALLAWLPRWRMVRGRCADAAVALGLVLLFVAFIFLDQKASYPSWRAALPVAATMLIVLAGNSSGLARMSLVNRPAIFVGLISYPLYLWHWPLLVFAAAVKLLPLTLLERGLVVALSFGLASATFLLLERPIRIRRPSGRQIAALSAVMMAIAATGLVIIRGAGFEDRFPVDVRIASKVSPPATMRVGICLLNLTIQSELSDQCIEHSRPIVVVWGDSTAASLMPGLRDLQSREQFGLVQATANSCMPTLGGPVSAVCRAHNERVAALIKELQPDVVLVHGFGPMGDGFSDGWARTSEFIALNSSKAIVLGPVPAWKRGLPGQMLSYYITHRSLLPRRSKSFVDNFWDDAAAAAFFAKHGATFVSAWAVLCNTEGCLTRMDKGTLSTFDTAHLSEQGSIFLIQKIADQILGGAGTARDRS